jgi:hypothetical protein
MSSQITNQVAYLRTTRSFPLESENLSLEMNKSYVDVANAVNSRTIGLYPVNTSAISGEQWFITSNQKQQGLRQVYTSGSTGSVPHGLNLQFIDRFTKCQGSWTDGTNWYGAIFSSSTNIPNQVTFYITPTNIVIQSSGIAVVQRVLIVLEWLSNV